MADRIFGTWAVVAGISLGFVFFRQYRGAFRYLYLPLYSAALMLLGIGRLQHAAVAPSWVIWALFIAGLIAMFRDSAMRYQETSERLKREREDRLRSFSDTAPDQHPPD